MVAGLICCAAMAASRLVKRAAAMNLEAQAVFLHNRAEKLLGIT